MRSYDHAQRHAGIMPQPEKEPIERNADDVLDLWKRDTSKGLFMTFWNPHSPQCMAAAAASAADAGFRDIDDDEAVEGDDFGEPEDAVDYSALADADAGTTDTTASNGRGSSKKSEGSNTSRPRQRGGSTGTFPWKPNYIKDRMASVFNSTGGTMDWMGLQGLINETFEVPESDGCPPWKARAVHRLLTTAGVLGGEMEYLQSLMHFLQEHGAAVSPMFVDANEVRDRRARRWGHLCDTDSASYCPSMHLLRCRHVRLQSSWRKQTTIALCTSS